MMKIFHPTIATIFDASCARISTFQRIKKLTKIGKVLTWKIFISIMKFISTQNLFISELQIYSALFHKIFFIEFCISQLNLKKFEPPKWYVSGEGWNFVSDLSDGVLTRTYLNLFFLVRMLPCLVKTYTPYEDPITSRVCRRFLSFLNWKPARFVQFFTKIFGAHPQK